MSKHTPGPWHYDPPCIKGCREDMYPILLDVEGSSLSDADCRLIAAAPDLLAALEWALDDPDGEILGGEWARLARAAIRKAKGE